jgi:hypothetical protein
VNFKLDENLSRRAADLIRAAGHDAVTVAGQGLQGAADETLFEGVCAKVGRSLHWTVILARCFVTRRLRAPA